MFRIVFFVEDSKLSKVLHAVQGMVLNMEPPQPVVNAVVEKGSVKAASKATSIKDMFLEYISGLPSGTVIAAANIKQVLEQLGGAASSYGHFISYAKEAKLVKPRSRGHFIRL